MKRKRTKQTAILLLSATLVGTNISFVYGAENTAAKNANTVIENTMTETISEEQSAAIPSEKEPSADSSATAGDSVGDTQNTVSPSKDEAAITGGKTEQSNDAETSENPENSADTEKADSPDSTETSGSNHAAENSAAENNRTEGNDTEGSNAENNGTVNESTESSSTENGSTENNSTESSGTEDSAGTAAGSNEETDTKNPDASEETSAPENIADAEETSQGTFINKNGEQIDPSALVGMDYTAIAGNYDGETNVIKQYAVSDSHEANTIMESYLDENGNLIMVISQRQQTTEASVQETEDSKDSAGFFSIASAPSVDGNFSGWDEIPVSYEYNWDNSANCWEYGNWVTDPETGEQVCYKTEQGTYDSNVRHEMQLYTDSENVYLKIKYATIYESHANGDDFNFYIDGAGAKYAVTWADGTPITGTTTAAGTYVVDVRNGDSSYSSSIVDGASAYYHVTENGINNELELRIPLSALQMQNGAINLDNFNMIQFFTPNLMYNPISAAGSPTGSIPFAAAAFLCVPAGYVWLKRKNEEDKAFA